MLLIVLSGMKEKSASNIYITRQILMLSHLFSVGRLRNFGLEVEGYSECGKFIGCCSFKVYNFYWSFTILIIAFVPGDIWHIE